MREDLRSLALTRAALERLFGDWPRHVPQVSRNIDVMRRADSCAEAYLARWEDLLRAGPTAIASVVLADTDEAQVLRSVHPLSGLLTPAERWAVLRAQRWVEADQRHRSTKRSNHGGRRLRSPDHSVESRHGRPDRARG